MMAPKVSPFVNAVKDRGHHSPPVASGTLSESGTINNLSVQLMTFSLNKELMIFFVFI